MIACSFCSYNVATLLVTHLKYPDPKLTPSQVEGNPTKPSFLLYLIWNFIPAFAFYVTYWTHCALGYHKSTHTSTWCWMWLSFFIHVTSFNFEEFRKAIFRVFCVSAKLSCHIFDAQCPVFYNLYKVLHGELWSHAQSTQYEM